MTLRKKILFYALLAFFTLTVLEGMARLAYYLAFAEWYPPRSAIILSADEAADFASAELAGLTRRPTPAQQDIFLEGRVSHPYYGFTTLSPNSPLNVMPPPQTRPDAVVIGVLGGSVSQEVTPYFQRELTRYFADQGLAKNPVVIPLALGSMKQPQQLHIAAFMLTMGGNFDILVNLDGYNELTDAHANFKQVVFPFFPRRWEKLVFLTRDEIALAGQIRAARARLTQLQQDGPISPFRYTALYGLLHRYQLQQAETRILQLNYDLANQGAARSLEQQGPYIPFQDLSQVHQETVRVWYRSSALLSRLAAAADADYYHFLQPNQYIPDSKPLSVEELRHHYHPDWDIMTNYAGNYPLFAQFGRELRQSGVNYFDLTRIFNDHPETLYRDGCCHLNGRGNELLAAAMVARLEPALQRHAAMPSSESAGILTVAAPLNRPPTLATPSPALPAALPAAPATAPDFQVSLRPGNLLVYAKDSCRPEHTRSPFFLHITPTSAEDLPAERRRHGFTSQDFSFTDAGRRNEQYGGGSCVIERFLPDYSIAALRTGQYNAGGEIWSTELSLSE